ncbi:MAG TPA: hypothetical protein VI792_06760 [Candidatus Eisenbacteria bacterium]
MCRRSRLALLGLACALAMGAAPARPAAPFQSTKVLLTRLRASGRAEAAIETTVEDLLGGPPRRVRGRLALELPHFARLDFEDGERLTLREDGGDWLQPRTRQLLRSGPRSAEAAMRWSALLLESGTGAFRERDLGGGGFELSPAGADSVAGERQRVWLDAKGLPARLEVGSPGANGRVYRLSGWRFTRAKGRAAFVLEAPKGIEVVDLP